MDYNYICLINKKICQENFKLHKENLFCFSFIEKQINNALLSNDDFDILSCAMKAATLIKLFQPFYDGNNRTALIVFGNIISQKGFIFDYESALNDMKNGKLNIPTLYTENDQIGKFDHFNKYITKISKEKSLF